MITKDADWLAKKLNSRPLQYTCFTLMSVGLYPFAFRFVFSHYLSRLTAIDYDPLHRIHMCLALTPLTFIGYVMFLYFMADTHGFMFMSVMCALIPLIVNRIWAFEVKDVLCQYYPTVYGISLDINPVRLFFFPVTTLIIALNTTRKESIYA